MQEPILLQNRASQRFVTEPIPVPQHPQKRNFNLKLGDIIYFKSYLSDDFKGVVSGDGIASNKLECVQLLGKELKLNYDILKPQLQSQITLQSKVASLGFNKCLFQVVNGKKYYYQNYLEEQKQQGARPSQIEQCEQKAREEIDENRRLFNHLNGTNLVYGQEIQLVHLYSNCTLTLNHQVLARQNCCRELSLEEIQNKHANFRIMSINNAKNVGELILYGDQVIIRSTENPQWVLGIQRPIEGGQALEGLEVNASEQPASLKVSSYLDNKTDEENLQQQIKGKFVQSGDVITLKSRSLSGFLAIRRKKANTDCLQKRGLFFKDFDTNTYKEMKQEFFDIPNLKLSSQIDEQYQLYVDVSDENTTNLNTLWQIQHKDSLNYYRATYESVFLIKHVSTGLFLELISDADGIRLTLTYDGLVQGCQFQLKSKKNPNDPIAYSEACKIQSVIDSQLIVQCQMDVVKVQKKSQKKYQEQSIFLLNMANEEMIKTANRINSLQTYLFQFYLFLQSWGIQHDQQGLYYEYYVAFNNQKSLSDQIQQLFQSLENLKLYLTNDEKPQSNEELMLKQQAVLDNDIINLLFAIQYLCNFMIFGQQKQNQSVPDKSPQKIAKLKLDPIQGRNCIQEIYSILQLCVQSNSLSSDYVLKLKIHGNNVLDFLLSQLKSQREHVSNLLKESVRYTDMSDAQNNIKNWVHQLQMVSEENIEDQTLYVEILSLMLIDPYENPNHQCQDMCRKLLEHKGHHVDPSPFQRGLLQCSILQDGGIAYPFIKFICGDNNQSGANFALQNTVFCKLYSKYVERLSRNEGRFHDIKASINNVVVDFFTTATIKKLKLIRQEDQKVDLPIFQKYENFVLQVLNLYASLCKGRNQKSIKFLLKCGINKEFLRECLRHFQSDSNELRFERTIISLYVNLLLDVDPLTSIIRFQNKTYLNEDLQKFDLNSYSGGFFYETNASRALKDSQEYKDFLILNTKQKDQLLEHQQLKAYAQKQIQQTVNGEQYSLLGIYQTLFMQEQYPEHLVIADLEDIGNKRINYNYELYAQYQLEYFLSVLVLIKSSIDLGYNELETNRKIYEILPNIFIAISLQQTHRIPLYKFDNQKNFQTNMNILQSKLESDDLLLNFETHNKQDIMEQVDVFNLKQKKFNKTWILSFIIWTTALCNDKLLCMKIYLEALSILKVFHAFKTNLQILSFIGEKQGNQSCIKEGSNPSVIFHSQDSISQRQIQDSPIMDVLQENMGVDMNSLLFNCLFSSEKRTKLNEEFIEILIASFNLPYYSTQEIQEVELIDDQMELQYFSIVNGNSQTNEWMSPREAELESKRAMKAILISPDSTKTISKQVQDSFDKVILYLNQILDQFLKIQTDNPTYLPAFQNIIRNAGVHLVFRIFLVHPQKIRSDAKIVEFYKNIIRFYEVFSNNNPTNIKEIAEPTFMQLLLLIPQLQQDQAQNIYYIPLKITKLIISIIAAIQIDHSKLIQEIFQIICRLGKHLAQSCKFFAVIRYEENETNPTEPYSPEVQTRNTAEDAIAMAAIIQYLKILKSMNKTFEKPAKSVPINKHLILTSILKNDFMRFIIEPVNFFEELLIPDQPSTIKNQNKTIIYYQMLLHANSIDLLTQCCQYYRLGIQEMQRILLYEQLKTILLHPQSYYLIKKAYLQCLFELYINKVYEGNQVNEVVENDEVRDILSRIIIPELDQKQIQKYLEGLARLNSTSKLFKKEQLDLRNQIKRQKLEYFEKRQNVSSEEPEIQLQCLRDVSEFWKYIRKNGVIHFLVYTYDEMRDRVDLERGEESNLSDEFAIIKQNVQKIKEIFNVLERDFRMKKEDLDLDEYRDLITSIEEIIPQRKITKFGQNFRIGFTDSKLMFDKYDTIKEDQTGEKKLQEQDSVQRIENVFQRNFKIYLIRNFVTIQQLLYFVDSLQLQSKEEMYGKILQLCNVHKMYISQEDVRTIREVDVERIKQQEKVNNPQKRFDDWEVFKQALCLLFVRKQVHVQIDGSLKQREEMKLGELKKKFHIAVKQTVGNNLNQLLERPIKFGQIQNEVLLSSDIQIQILILNIEKQQDILQQDSLTEFLKKCQQIFLGKEIYLIKLCRIFLESKQPTADEIETLSEQSADIDKNKQKLEEFRQFQRTIAEGDIDTMALEFLAGQNVAQELQVEAITLLVSLLEYGNEAVQQRLLNLLKDDQNIKNSFIAFLREFFMIDVATSLLEMKLSPQETIYEQLSLKVLKLLQGMCENVNVQFQKFLVIQNEDDSYTSNMNIVAEVSTLLANILESQILDWDKKNRIVRQAMESLIEFSTGYPDNKKELCKNTRLFTLLNQIAQPKVEHRVYFKEMDNFQDPNVKKSRYESYRTLESFIKLLLAMTQGNADQKSLQFILEMVDISTLLSTARDIFEYRINLKLQNIILDNICDETTYPHDNCDNYYCHVGFRSDEDNLLIQTGFNIFIICIKLSETFPQDPKLEIFKFDEDKDDEFDDDDPKSQLRRDLSRGFSKKSQIMPMSKYEEVDQVDYDLDIDAIKKIVSDVNKDPTVNFTRKDKFFKFYREYTGRIEIQNTENELEKIYFQKPFLCKFMTPNIKYHLIYESKRETDEDRMLSLIENSDFYQIQLVHSQKINNRPILHFGAAYWRVVKDISFILCLVIVILLIFMHDTVINSKLGSSQDAPEDNYISSGEIFVSYLNNIITIIQLIQNLMIIFFCAVERYPISITYKKGETNAKKVQILKKESGFSISSLTMIYYSIVGYFEKRFEESEVKNSKFRKAILVLFLDFDNFYNICIFALTCYAFFNPYIYAILLLDIVKRSEDLQNIIKSITSNGRNLAIFSFLGFIGLLLYAIIAFNNFRNDFSDGVYSYDFILAVTSTINFGLRNGGGIGESMESYPDPSEEDNQYWGRYFFDFTFFIVFNILFIQIIFGIILDTFGELRDERQALIKEIEGKCFICSLARNDIDTKGTKGWYYHIYLEHNAYHMLYYIIYLKSKNLNDCNALEKYVKECIDNKQTQFFPFNRALQIEEDNQS